MASSPDIPGLKYASHQYGQHQLQRVGVWQFEEPETAPSTPAYWIMYVCADVTPAVEQTRSLTLSVTALSMEAGGETPETTSMTLCHL